MAPIFISLTSILIFCSTASGSEMNALLMACAPDVHPDTMGAIVNHESRGNFLVIGDNGNWKLPAKDRVHRTFYPSTPDQAVATAEQLINAGHVIDIGLGQLNNRNLTRLNLTLREAFEPCKNIWGASRVLVEFYQNASRKYGAGQQALYAAISAYNTGSYIRGFQNGYVQKVVSAGQRKVPSLNMGTPSQRKIAAVSSKRKTAIVSKSQNIEVASATNSPGYVRGWEN